MAQLHWRKSEDGKSMVLLAGCNTAELAVLHKRAKWWSLTIWLPECGDYLKEYAPLEKQMAAAKKVVRAWFDLAETDLPAMDNPESD